MKTGFYFTPDANGWFDKKQRQTVSSNPLEALENATGNFCWHIDYANKRKLVFLGCYNAENILRQFACECALDVIHLWKPPEIVIRYLQTRDESIRNAAKNAAWGAAWNAAKDAAWGDAWGAAKDAAWGAAKDAALKGYNDKLKEMLKLGLCSQQRGHNEEKNVSHA